MDVVAHPFYHLFAVRQLAIFVLKHPWGCLTVPYKNMACDLQPVVLSEFHELVGILPIELSLFRFDILGFHTVLGHDAVEVFLHHLHGLRLLSVNLTGIHGASHEEVFS